MQTFRAAGCLFSELVTSRLASHAAASCSIVTPLEQGGLHSAPGSYMSSCRLIHTGVCCQAPADTAGGTAAGQTDGHNNVESQTQPENSAETVLPQVRAKRLTRAERPQYLDNEDFEEELKESSILVEPDIPIYDLRQVLQKVGLPLEPQTPLFEKLQKMSPAEVEDLLNTDKEEVAPFEGARRILNWEQRIVLSHGSFAGEHPVNRKAKCTVYLRELQAQTGLTDEALQLIARVCGPRYEPKNGLLTLVSEKHGMREDNRRHIMEMLADLVLEGHQAFPSDSANVEQEEQAQTA
ncbi:hypothetical protein ABBQ38_000647 [Trebouxia sp. C0009 RCD-2024]